MEKYSQFRDKGSGVAPFFPIPRESSGLYLPIHIVLFTIRLPLVLAASVIYFFIFTWLPVGSLLKKAALWLILGIPGIWWVDLQIDGVKRGSLAKHKERLPHPGTVIASSFTSPIDCLYLAAIFDPIFTASYPNTKLVQPISLFQAIWRALTPPLAAPPAGARLVSLAKLVSDNPDSSVVVLPECTTSNGRAILPISPSLLSVNTGTKVFPVSLRYSPADVTTPVPGAYLSFIWDLCSRPTHVIRVRIAEAVYVPKSRRSSPDDAYDTEPSTLSKSFSSAETLINDDKSGLNASDHKVLQQIADDLARLGRAKRVSLGVQQKIEFIKIWTKTRRIW